MPATRLHLVVPSDPGPDAAACFAAACETGGIASLLAPAALAPQFLAASRRHDVALLTTDPGVARSLGCDGVEVSSRPGYDAAREILGYNHIVGVFCGASRHLAMELADAGADYIAFSQSHDRPDAEPIIAWWSELFEIHCIAADPAAPEALAALLSQRPDFIRPADAMWRSPEDARAIISATRRAIGNFDS